MNNMSEKHTMNDSVTPITTAERAIIKDRTGSPENACNRAASS